MAIENNFYNRMMSIDRCGHRDLFADVQSLLRSRKNEKPFVGKTVRSCSPYRISFAGGGSDLSSFISTEKSVVVNMTIDKYFRSELCLNNGKVLRIFDLDSKEYFFESKDELKKSQKFSAIYHILMLFDYSGGMDLKIQGDVGIGTGLGGSSAFIASLLECFYYLFDIELDIKEKIQIAYYVERVLAGDFGGWQDQVATIHGGFNRILFDKEITVDPIVAEESFIKEFISHFFLVDLKKRRCSGDIFRDKINKMTFDQYKDEQIRNRDLALKLADCLNNENLDLAISAVNESFKIKTKISSMTLEEKAIKTYREFLENGAMGGKYLGGGFGGYYLLLVDGDHKKQMMKNFEDSEISFENIKLERSGSLIESVSSNGFGDGF